MEPGWSWADVSLVGLGVGSILFDGLSQTQIFFDLFGTPSVVASTILLVGFLAIVVAAAGAVGRIVGRRPPGQAPADRVIPRRPLFHLFADRRPADLIAISDPFQRG
jgi:hypothetical protein